MQVACVHIVLYRLTAALFDKGELFLSMQNCIRMNQNLIAGCFNLIGLCQLHSNCMEMTKAYASALDQFDNLVSVAELCGYFHRTIHQ